MSDMDCIEIRPFKSIDEFQKCVEFQAHTWGGHFTERVPIAILKVSQRLGGISSGAYDTKGQLVGFIFGMTGVQNGEVVHWSDMLAVKPELRNSGLGVRLKDYQRKALLAKGIRKMHWTFDPLESKNAYLNLNKLGATSKEYVRDIYGQTDSPLHSGIGTDRLVTTWILDSPRTIERIQSEAPNSEAAQKVRHLSVFEVEKKHGLVRPMQPNLNLAVPAVSIPIPLSIQSLKKASLELAVEWRVAVRDSLTTYITEGYEVTDLLRREDYSEYLLLEAKRLG
jgi:predicted GNAT superfamily acetyltransferase